MKKNMTHLISFVAILLVFVFTTAIIGCGSGGDATPGPRASNQVVSGVASAGAPLVGQVKLKDAATPNREKTTVIGSDGSFAIDVTDMKAPFVLQAAGSVRGVRYEFYSFAHEPGIANINPLSNAAVAKAAGVDDPATLYANPSSTVLNRVESGLATAVTSLCTTLQPLLAKFDAVGVDPIRGKVKADHTGLDGMFDNVHITLTGGILTIRNEKSDVEIFKCRISDTEHGEMTTEDDDFPTPGAVPAAPSDVKAVGGSGQVTISWHDVCNALFYNIYWSTTSGVTKTNGTKIAGVRSPYVHMGLSSGTTLYYIVTAVNSAGESAGSGKESATTNAAPSSPTVPAVPAGVIGTGGTNQVTVSWTGASGATSYNIYYSTTSGVTPTTGTKITGATSPAVIIGLAKSTTYFAVVTAANSARESAPSVQVAATTLPSTPPPTVPAAPTGVTALGGTNRVTVSWPAVPGATSYNVYWATTTGVTTTSGTLISGVTSPFVQTGLSAGTTYFYIVTAVNSVGVSSASPQISAITHPPSSTLPPAPVGGTALGGANQVTISWTAVTGATSYNVYWSTTSGVTVGTGTKITGATNPFLQTGLAAGTPYFYIVTAVNAAGEGPASAQFSAATNSSASLNTAIVLAANDLGMHCMDREFSIFSILPPFNVVQAQALMRSGTGTPVLLSDATVTVRYDAITDAAGSINTTSIGKTNFWQYGNALFGATLQPGQGLLGYYMPGDDPLHRGPQPMAYDAAAQSFGAFGIPITPLDDALKTNTYPLMRISVAEKLSGNTIGRLDVVVPVASETDCQTCHKTGGIGSTRSGVTWAADADLEVQAKKNILLLHDFVQGTTLAASTPVLCARCHYSPALDLAGTGPAGQQIGKLAFSRVMHTYHSDLVINGVPPFPPNGTIDATCYQCHPGKITRCMRGAMANAGLDCTDCHGGMAAVGAKFPLLAGGSIDGANDGQPRRPWKDLPRCQSCHTGDAVNHLTGGNLVPDANWPFRLRQTYRTGDNSASPLLAVNKRFAENANTLYRFSRGHGGINCNGCHGSTHSEWPNAAAGANDNVAAIQLQGYPGTVMECTACHAAGTLPATINGPHGMHNVNDARWYDGDHEDFYEKNPAGCRTCHGLNLTGTPLAKAAAARTFTVEEKTITLAKGTLVGCNLCHEMPH